MEKQMPQFISHEHAKILKELGFNELCFAQYDIDNELVILVNNVCTNSDFKLRFDKTAAPLYQQAIEFLLEKLELKLQYEIISIRIFTDKSGTIYLPKLKEMTFDNLDEGIKFLIDLL